jgi:hypothetical protein
MIDERQESIRQTKEPSPTLLSESSLTQAPCIELIEFDKKAKVYVGICLFLYLLFVVFKLHNSSIPLWNLTINDGGNEKRGLIAGKPLANRSDEWLVGSSFVLAQEKSHFPVSNEALGDGKTPLLMGLPTKHVLSKIRPALWGYYFLDKERAFSWQWNFKIFPFLISSFLFLMLFTKNNFLISLFGSIWLFLSSAVQWWSIYTEAFTFTFLLIISFIYILYSNRPRIIILNGLIFLLASYSYVVLLYPAYQLPLAYFCLALTLGFIMSRKNFETLLDRKFLKLSVLVVSLISALLLVYFFYMECQSTIRVLANTVYPGKRNVTGGGFSFVNLFRDNFSWFLGESVFPPKWGNMCEVSSFLMLSPIVIILIGYHYLKKGIINSLLIPLLILQIILYIWLRWGFPQFLSRITLFNVSPPHRAFFVFGFSNVILTLLYLGQFKTTTEQTSITTNKLVAFISVFVTAFGIHYYLNKEADRFFSIFQIFNATVLFSLLNWLIIYFRERKIYQYLFATCCILFIASNIFVNPLSKGLSPYFENKIYKTATEINSRDPKAGWLVFGHMAAPNFLKAAGINCFDGVQYAPQLAKLRILDPEFKNSEIFNRYAHIVFDARSDEKDSVHFSLLSSDYYHVLVDPCSPRLKEMGIKYFMFSYKPPDAQVRCMTPVKDTCGFFIYKRKDL